MLMSRHKLPPSTIETEVDLRVCHEHSGRLESNLPVSTLLPFQNDTTASLSAPPRMGAEMTATHALNVGWHI
jgi:hypothetical protein